MKNIISGFAVLLILSSFVLVETFKEQQLKYERVRNAYKNKEETVKDVFLKANVAWPPKEIFIRAFKAERDLEIWARGDKDTIFKLVHTYKFCSFSGEIGPKRTQGDGQIPEGFYHIDRFNPVSNFHLSLGVNYPNASDKVLGKAPYGGDIFLHGNCVTIGCIPITDDKIQELYIMAIEAKNKGQEKIPVHFFPLRMDEDCMETLETKHSKDKTLLAFWTNLKPVYDAFEKTNKIPKVSIGTDGKYSLK